MRIKKIQKANVPSKKSPRAKLSKNGKIQSLDCVSLLKKELTLPILTKCSDRKV
jgi:hypothetical protein